MISHTKDVMQSVTSETRVRQLSSWQLDMAIMPRKTMAIIVFIFNGCMIIISDNFDFSQKICDKLKVSLLILYRLKWLNCAHVGACVHAKPQSAQD